ncbi:hypothetical protein BGW38_010427, partial [Lunasporangiospora selenospora]
RERIADLVIEQARSPPDVARNFNIPLPLSETLFDSNGRVNKLPRGGNNRSRVEKQHIDIL